MKKKAFHLFDDDKFVDLAIDLIEDNNDNRFSNTYIIFSNTKELKYVKNKNVRINHRKDIDELLTYINESCDFIFFHALDGFKRYIAKNISPDIIKIWLLWGFELYNDWNLLTSSIYDKETLKYLNIQRSLYDKIFNNITFYKLSQKYLPSTIFYNFFYSEYLSIIRKMDYVSPIIESEYDIIRLLNPKIKILPFSYGYLELFISNQQINFCNRRNILIGNSADPSNNHISILHKLSKIDTSDRKIIIPLSYSGSDEYKNKIIELGYKYFGDNFIPLVKFMPLKEYNDLISSCEIVFFNHIRQQALGNFINLGFNGAKIFFNRKNPVYKHFKEKGFTLFKIDNKINLEEKLTLEQIGMNKKILYNDYNHDFIKTKISNFFNTLFNSHG